MPAMDCFACARNDSAKRDLSPQAGRGEDRRYIGSLKFELATEFLMPGLPAGIQGPAAACARLLFGAAHQLHRRLCGLHEAAIDGEIIQSHAPGGEVGFEPLSDGTPAQL